MALVAKHSLLLLAVVREDVSKSLTTRLNDILVDYWVNLYIGRLLG